MHLGVGTPLIGRGAKSRAECGCNPGSYEETIFEGKGAFAPATVVRRASLPADVSYQVSSALTYGRWTLLGSPWDLGPYVCG